MPYDASKEKQVEYGMIPKNERGEYIRVGKVTSQSSQGYSTDVRLFYTDNAGDIRPTQKGLRIPSKHMVETMRSMFNAMDETEKAEFIEAITPEED